MKWRYILYHDVGGSTIYIPQYKRLCFWSSVREWPYFGPLGDHRKGFYDETSCLDFIHRQQDEEIIKKEVKYVC